MGCFLLHNGAIERYQLSVRLRTSSPRNTGGRRPSRPSQSDDDDAYLRLLRIKEAAERKNAEKPAVPTPVKQTEPAPRKSTEAESDRRTAVWLALNAIKRFVKSPFRTEFFAEQSDQRSSVARLIGRDRKSVV